jgi:hypothetical protein
VSKGRPSTQKTTALHLAEMSPVSAGGKLLEFLVPAVAADEVLKNGQDMLAVAHDAFKQRAKLRLMLRLPIPLCQNCCGYLDIPAQLIGGMTTEEQAVEKGCLALRELQFSQGVFERV